MAGSDTYIIKYDARVIVTQLPYLSSRGLNVILSQAPKIYSEFSHLQNSISHFIMYRPFVRELAFIFIRLG